MDLKPTHKIKAPKCVSGLPVAGGSGHIELEALLPEISHAIITVIGLSLLGAIIGLDYIAWGQTILAQPVIGGVIAGFAAGEPVLGFWSGMVFQFLWAGKLPIGQYVPPNSCNAALFAVIVGASLPESIPLATRAVASGVLAVPVGILGGRWDVSVKKGNAKTVEKAQKALADGDFGGINRGVLTGLLRFFGKDFALLLTASVLGVLLIWPVLVLIGDIVAPGAKLAFRVLPAVGVGAALRGFDSRRNRFGYIAGLVIGIATLLAVNWDIIAAFFKG